MTADLRFWTKVDLSNLSGCWPWEACLNKPNGYGLFQVTKTKRVVAHRWSYERLIGPISEGMEIDHLCRNRQCVNPMHMEAVTHYENTMRGQTIPAMHAAKTHCPHGHPYDEENTFINVRGSRECRTCTRTRNRTRKQALKAALQW